MHYCSRWCVVFIAFRTWAVLLGPCLSLLFKGLAGMIVVGCNSWNKAIKCSSQSITLIPRSEHNCSDSQQHMDESGLSQKGSSRLL